MKSRTLLILVALVALLAVVAGGTWVVLRPTNPGPTETDENAVDTDRAEDPGTDAIEAADDPPPAELSGPRVDGAGPHFDAVTGDGDASSTGALDALARHDWNRIGAQARKLRRVAASVAANELADRDAPAAEYEQFQENRQLLDALLEELRSDLDLHPVERTLDHPLVHANLLAALLHAEGEPLTQEQARAIERDLATLMERRDRERKDWNHDTHPLVAKYGEARFADELRGLFHGHLSREQRRAVRPGEGHEIARLDPFSPTGEFLGWTIELLFRGDSVEAEWIAMELEERLSMHDRREELETVARAWVESLPAAIRRPEADHWRHLRLFHTDDELLELVGAEVELRDLLESTLELDPARSAMIRRMPVIWRFTRTSE